MSVQRRVFGDVKNTINDTPAAGANLRNQKIFDKTVLVGGGVNATPARAKLAGATTTRSYDAFATPSVARSRARTPFAVYSADAGGGKKTSALRAAKAKIDAETVAETAEEMEHEPIDTCTYLPEPDTYEDVLESHRLAVESIAPIENDDEFEANYRNCYSVFTCPEFSEERFFREMMADHPQGRV